jgi:TraG P-loop domain
MFSALADNEIAKALPYFELFSNGIVTLIDGRAVVGATFDLPAAPTLGARQLEQIERGLREIASSLVPSNGVLNWHVTLRKSTSEVIDQFKESLETNHELTARWSQAIYRKLSQQIEDGSVLTYHNFVTISYGQVHMGVAAPNVVMVALSKVLKGLAQRTHVARTAEDFGENIQSLGLEIQNGLVRNLRRLGFNPRAMNGDDVFRAIRSYTTPGRRELLETYVRPEPCFYTEEQYRRDPKIGVWTLRAQCVEQEVFTAPWDHLKIGHHYLQCFAMTDYPETSKMNTMGAMLNALAEMPGEVHFVMQLYHPDREMMETKLNQTFQNLDSLVEEMPIVDPAMRERRNNMDILLKRAERNNEGFFDVMGILILADTDREVLKNRVAAFRRSAGEVPGRPFNVMRTGILQPFLEAMPFSGRRMTRGVTFLESQAVAQLPLGGTWQSGHAPQLLFKTRKGTLLPLALRGGHVRAYNMVIIGETGGGKSYTAQVIMSFLARYERTRLNVIDVGGSYHPLFSLFTPRSVAVRLTTRGDMRFNPFDLAPGMSQPDDEKISFLLALFKLCFRLLPGEQLGRTPALLEEAIKRTYNAATITKEDFEVVVMKDCTVSQLRRALVNLRQVGQSKMTADDLDLARSMAMMLEGWCGEKTIGRLIDGESTVELGEATMVYWDLSAIGVRNLELASVAVSVVNDYIQTRLRPEVETHTFLDDIDEVIEKLPAMADLINDGYRRGRKLNASTTLVTQLWEDLPEKVKELTFFYWIISANKSAPDIAAHTKLPAEAADIMRNLGHREVFLIVRENDGTKAETIRIETTAEQHWAFTTNPAEVPLRKKTLERFNGDWNKTVQWLAKTVTF